MNRLAAQDKIEGFIGELAFSKRRVLMGNFSAFSGFSSDAVKFPEFSDTLLPSTVEHSDSTAKTMQQYFPKTKRAAWTRDSFLADLNDVYDEEDFKEELVDLRADIGAKKKCSSLSLSCF